jgi:hypothetical protein
MPNDSQISGEIFKVPSCKTTTTTTTKIKNKQTPVKSLLETKKLYFIYKLYIL